MVHNLGIGPFSISNSFLILLRILCEYLISRFRISNQLILQFIEKLCLKDIMFPIFQSPLQKLLPLPAVNIIFILDIFLLYFLRIILVDLPGFPKDRKIKIQEIF